MVAITAIDVQPIGAPPTGFGGDARNIAQGGPTYANAVLEIHTDDPELCGSSVIFTNGHGLKEMCAVARDVAHRFLLMEDWLPPLSTLHLNGNLGRFCKRMLRDSDYSWLGGVGLSRMAIGAVANALWDLTAKMQQVPAWHLIADMTPEALLEFVDFEPIFDVLSPEQALAILQKAQEGKHGRISDIYERGLLAYNTAGWSGISNEGLVGQTQKMLKAGWPQIKIKVGASYSAAHMKADQDRKVLSREDLDRMALDAARDDAERMLLVYQAIEQEDPRPEKMKVAVDSNQVFDARSAFVFAKQLALTLYEANPSYQIEWFEEPCNQHSAMAHVQLQQQLIRAFAGYDPPLRVPVSTGEQGASPVTFKDLLHAPALDGGIQTLGNGSHAVDGSSQKKYAIDVIQMDYARVGGIGDNLAILLLAQKAREEGRDVRICPHTGGIGLCEGMRNVQAIKQALFGPTNLAGVPDILEYVAEEERSVHEGVFKNPAIVDRGYYQMSRAAGVGVDYSARGKQEYTLPDGKAWQANERFSVLARKFMQVSPRPDVSSLPRAAKPKRRFTLLRAFAPADFITLANAACGMGAILCCLNYASSGHRLSMVAAFALLPAAFIFDALDGLVARATRRSSVYGGDLDSLADIVSFGVAPAVMGYVLGLNGTGDAVILCGFVMCGIARLARFNVSALELTTAKGKVSHFEGAPIPSSLLLVLGIIVAFYSGAVHESIWWGDVSWGLRFHPIALFYAAWGALMVTATVKIPKP